MEQLILLHFYCSPTAFVFRPLTSGGGSDSDRGSGGAIFIVMAHELGRCVGLELEEEEEESWGPIQ